MRFSAVILAGGKGERFKSSISKQLMSLNGKPVLQYCLDVIEPLVDEVIIVSNSQYKDYKCVPGGLTRSESAYNWVMATTGDFVIIHEGARPFLRSETIQQIKELLLCGNDCVDTVSPIIDGYVHNGVSKSKVGRFLGLTPEAFRKDILVEAFLQSPRRDWMDEITMVQTLKPESNIAFIKGESFNSKITFEQDLAYSEGIMKFWNRPIATIPDLSRNVLVFGGTGGIGSACIRRLPNYYAPSHKEIDLSTNDWEIDLKEYKAIIHSAGEYSNQEKVMEVNFNSCVRLVELAEKQNWKGNMVFLSSASATYGRKGIPIYSASKSALNAYIESRHEELAEKGIYLNAIAPSKVDTKLQTAINPNTPRDSMLTPDYVADFVLRYTDTKVSGHIIYLKVGFND